MKSNIPIYLNNNNIIYSMEYNKEILLFTISP